LVVVGAGWERAGFIDEFLVPCSAHQEDAALFGEGEPWERTVDLVAFDRDAGESASLNFSVLAQVLDDSAAVCRELDAEFRVGLFADASQDVAALLGVFDSLAIDIVDIDISL